MARSGSTILLNSIYKTDIFASLTYADMPFVLAPNLWSKISLIRSKSNLMLKEGRIKMGLKYLLLHLKHLKRFLENI